MTWQLILDRNSKLQRDGICFGCEEGIRYEASRGGAVDDFMCRCQETADSMADRPAECGRGPVGRHCLTGRELTAREHWINERKRGIAILPRPGTSLLAVIRLGNLSLARVHKRGLRCQHVRMRRCHVQL